MTERMKMVVILASGCWMFGEGSRMIVESIKGDSVYVPSLNGVDIWFDWLPLVVLGSVLFYWGLKSFHMEMQVRATKKEKGGRAIGGVARDSLATVTHGFKQTLLSRLK
jgi:hypothetical protein